MIQFIPVQGGRQSQNQSSSQHTADPAAGSRPGCVISVGQGHVCVLSFEDGLGGSDDTGLRIAAAAAGSGILLPEIEDGVIRMRAAHGGLLRFGKEAVIDIHCLGGVRIDILGQGTPVAKNQLVAEIRFDPGQAGSGLLNRLEEICHRCHPVIDILPFRESKIGLLSVQRHGEYPREVEILAGLRRRVAELGSVFAGELSVDAGSGRDEVEPWLAARGIDMLLLVGDASPETESWVTYADRRPGGDHGAGEMLPARGQQQTGGGFIPVLWLPAAVLQDWRLIADVLVPLFLAGLEMPEGEDGREYGRAGRLYSGLFSQ